MVEDTAVEETLRQNAIAAEKLDTSLAHALTLAAVQAMVVEDTARLVEGHNVPGAQLDSAGQPAKIDKRELTCLVFVSACSYSCGGVGHMSRDCVQGSKCYNCSQVVSCLLSFRE